MNLFILIKIQKNLRPKISFYFSPKIEKYYLLLISSYFSQQFFTILTIS